MQDQVLTLFVAPDSYGGFFLVFHVSARSYEGRGSVELKRNEGLSRRSVTILRMLASEKRISEIAQTLKISRSTVHTNIRRIWKKFGVKSTIQMMIVATKLGLFDDL